ncbi:metal ABC transporter permease [Brytella acorum]|uniref:Metal ABC transporter permease n=1 Tax=Brytella acorum TaxID=2959299 RepID=A0AA35UX14_9PROT|nr:metal ABC transporter permease [Brytella acorum]MDF3625075.1 metal ABC transporter permease [Brytella acorum]CAI9121046.1 metal ABC transporter permease [Brytella acorum]
MLEFEFMRHAFMAAALVGALSGVTGWFLVLRGQSFAGHALSHIGFAGAAGAVLLGCPPLLGMTFTTALAALGMGWESSGDSRGHVSAGRDSIIGLILAASLGLGTLFLQWSNAPSNRATALLFGNILGVDGTTLLLLGGMSVACFGTLACIARPLLFLSLDPDMAVARGVPGRLVSLVFMVLVALSTAMCAEVTGVLLVFSLLVGPAATMLRLGLSPWKGVFGAAVLAVVYGWGALALSWWTDAPVSFWIGLFAAVGYGAAWASARISGAGSSRAMRRGR